MVPESSDKHAVCRQKGDGGRTVDGINDESRLWSYSHARLVRLLAHERDRRVGGRQPRRDHLLNRLVHLCDNVHSCVQIKGQPSEFSMIQDVSMRGGTVEFGSLVNVSRVSSQHHCTGLVRDRDHLVAHGLEIEIRHLCCAIGVDLLSEEKTKEEVG